MLLAVEHGHRGKRGFYASWPQAGVPLGLLTSTWVMAAFEQKLSAEDFLAWGWRVPFFLSGFLIALGLLMRVRIMETPLFQEVQKTDRVAEAPVKEVLSRHWREVLLAAGARVAEQSCFYLFSMYVIAYVSRTVDMASGIVLDAVKLAAGVEFFTIPVFGLLADHWSRKGTYVLGCLFLIGFAFPYFALLGTRQTVWVVTAVVVSLAVGHALLYSVQASLIPELFGTRLRYTGASLAYQLASPFAGGLAPLIAAALAEKFPGQYWPLAAYVIAISVLSLVCVQCLAETSRKDISGTE